MENDRLSGKQVGSQASRRVTRRLAWIQPVCISINAVPALKGLILNRLCFVQNSTRSVFGWSSGSDPGPEFPNRTDRALT